MMFGLQNAFKVNFTTLGNYIYHSVLYVIGVIHSVICITFKQLLMTGRPMTYHSLKDGAIFKEPLRGKKSH